ncbi:MAG: NUDIX hydrolase N-terminal domain-containing protein [Sedimentisphaerales bacterium]|nr:NUDIX hydrolase N-terminal domain-containing protein [Sedimentisphaerales bacterium]
MTLNWFEIAKKLKVISQAGRHFARDDYEMQRHQDIAALAADILAYHTQLESDQTKMILEQDTGYPTPKVDARGVVFRDDNNPPPGDSYSSGN